MPTGTQIKAALSKVRIHFISDDEMREILEAAEAAGEPVKTRVRHKKRGSTYEVIGTGKMQAEDWHDIARDADGSACGPSVDMREVTIYRSEDDGQLWVRPIEEFNDGRFSAIATRASS